MSIGMEKLVSDYLLRLNISNEEDNDKAIIELENLTDRFETGEKTLEPIIDYLTGLIQKYEDEHYPIVKPSPVEMLKHLMENHHHTQTDLKDIATQSIISDILSGKREMNLGHIRRLSEKYGVSPEVFI